MRKTIGILMLAAVLSGCVSNGYESLAEAMKQGGIAYGQIYHQHEVDNGLVIFYENPNGGFDAGIVYTSGDRYQWGFGGGTVSAPVDDDVSWGWVNLDSNAKETEKRHQLYYGIINEPQIRTLHITNKGSGNIIDKDAEIVELPDGTRLWFALQDKYSSIHQGFTLTGYDKDGAKVYHFD